MRWASMTVGDAAAQPDARDEDRLEDEEGHVSTPPAAVTTDGVGQGSYVASFTMTREQIAAGIDAARTALPQLLSECSWGPGDGKSVSGSHAWRRVKSGKSAARVWDKGGGGRFQRVLRKLPPTKPSMAAIQLEADASTASGSATSASATALTGSESDGSGSAGRSVYSVRSSVTVDAPLDAVLKTLDASVLTAHRSFTKIIYGGVVAEATVLSHHDRPRSAGHAGGVAAAEAESLAVRWLVCRCSSPMVSDCDLCLQEYTRRFSIDELTANSGVYNNNNNNDDDDDGDDGGGGSPRLERVRDGLHAETEMPAAYKLFQSVETRCCPELLESQRLVRARVPLGGFLLYPTDSSERTDVVFFMSVAQKRGDRQARALQAVALEMARRVERLRNAVDAYKMSLRMDALRASRWVDDAARPECAVCSRRFHQLSRRRHHCRLCGEVICRDCSVHKDADLPTIGPTVLRICRQCDASTDGLRLQMLQASSSPPSSSVAAVASSSSAASNQSSHRSSRMDWRRVTSISTSSTTPAPTTPTVAAGSKTPKRDGKPATPTPSIESRRRFSTAGDSVSQALSCPKPTPEHRSLASKFAAHNSEAGARLAAKAVATTPTMKSHAYPSPMPGVWRAVGGTPSRWTGSSSSNAVHSDATDAPTAPGSTHRAKALSSAAPPARSPMQRWQRLSVDENASSKLPRRVLAASAVPPGSPNQRGEASSSALPLTPRGISKPQEVQGILVELCAQAAALCGTKYAALSLFREQQLSSSGSSSSLRASTPSQHPEDDAATGVHGGNELAARMEHFLKVRGSHKLMNVAPNLKSCEPVLALRRSVATRNAAAASARLAFDFQQLPIVAGPQQARFYAGVLLVDDRGQWLGALAVFDSRVGVHKSEDRELQAMLQSMETLASNAVAAIKEREKELALQHFLRSPLVETRNSEPASLLGHRRHRADYRSEAIVERDGEEMEEDRRQDAASSSSSSATASPQHAREFYRRKMRELVLQAQETQAQTLENSVAMKRGGLIT